MKSRSARRRSTAHWLSLPSPLAPSLLLFALALTACEMDRVGFSPQDTGPRCDGGVCGADAPVPGPTCSDGQRNGDEVAVDCGGACPGCPDGTACDADRDCASALCVASVCAAPRCDDGRRDGDETDVDCGGPDCDPCAEGRACEAARDCETGVCGDGTCRAASCGDAVQNGGETDVDCGGSCAPCAVGDACVLGADCESGVCEASVCVASRCGDGVTNGDEADVDCGGACPGCPVGGACRAGDDCLSRSCSAGGECLAPACDDGATNGTESDVDCGGTCTPCETGSECTEGGDCASGVCASRVCAAPACDDGATNGTESDVDCGGECAPCATGASCGDASDCASGVCDEGVCVAASCVDGVQNDGETDLDCGGPCAPCGDGASCAAPSDCESRVCTADVCAAPTCSDGVENGDETDVDCGGGCAACGVGETCDVGDDCESGVCDAHVCAAPTCNDGVENGSETGIDCGGAACGPCGTGGGCGGPGDCVSGVCSASVCAAPTCTDGVRNGSETGTDCGGASCAACPAGGGCSAASDCASRICVASVCAAPTCTDGVRNGSETGTDCGGTCTPCAAGGGCSAASDCASGVCSANVCAAPTCTDGVRNGSETGTDCGGACAACGTGGGCSVASDCASRVCSASVCAAPTCTDGVRNGSETDVDCGGGTCAGCAEGDACATGADCATGHCAGGACVVGPSAGFTIAPASGSAPLTVTATSTATRGTAPITQTRYDWGDGGGFVTATSHTYAAAGSFTVTQEVRDGHAIIATTTRSVVVDDFVPVRFSLTDITPGTSLTADGLGVESWPVRGGVRSNRAIAPGSGVFYFEAERLIERGSAYGTGVGTAAADLTLSPGANAQSLGAITGGGIDASGSTCTGGTPWFARSERFFGYVVDYRGASPIVHVLLDGGSGTPYVKQTCAMTVTTPLHIFYSGERYELRPQMRINPGNDTTNHPFHFSAASVRQALIDAPASASSAAAALVMGWGQTRARAVSAAPVLTTSPSLTVSPGTPVSLTASALDAEDGDLTASIQWEDIATQRHARTTGTGASFSFTPTSVGRHPIVVSVTDSFEVTTTRTIMVNVTGTPPQYDPVVLTPDALTGQGITVAPDGLGARFDGFDKYGIRANQPIYGQFWYFEATRQVPPSNIGMGLVTGDGDLDPYEFGRVPYSMSVNTLGGTWRNLVWQSSWPSASSTYGLAVDYRGEHPIVYVIIGGAVQSTMVLDDVWLPLYPMLYANPTVSVAPALDWTINFGTGAFVYDVRAILAGQGVDVSGLVVGWGGFGGGG